MGETSMLDTERGKDQDPTKGTPDTGDLHREEKSPVTFGCENREA